MEKNLKLYYSIGEVAQITGVNETTLRYWEKQFPQLSPKKAGRGIRQYTADNVELLKVICHLVKECGLTIAGAKMRLASDLKMKSPDRNAEIIERLKHIREELVAMRNSLDSFTYQQQEELKDNLQHPSSEA